MTAKQYLMRAWQIEKRIDRLIAERDALFQRVENVRSPVISDMPRGGRRADWTGAVDALVDLCTDIDREIRELCRVKLEVNEAIDRVEDMRLRRVLELRYRSYMSWEKIAEEMGYEVRWIYVLHGKALLEIGERVH